MSAFSLPFRYTERAPAPVFHGRNSRPLSSEYQATATALVQYQGDLLSLADRKVEVGLLLETPSPEGGHVLEPPLPNGYARQPASFTAARAGQALRNRERITFTFWESPAPNAKCVGVFLDGKLYFYGRLEETPRQPAGTAERASISIGQESLILAFHRPR